MVEFKVVSEYSKDAPTVAPVSGAQRAKIAGGPLYDLRRAQEISKGTGNVNLWTRKCIGDVRNLYEPVRDSYESDIDLVASLVQELEKSGKYIDSEWCFNGTRAWAACDAYKITRSETLSGDIIVTDYYVKFAIAKTGAVLLMASCHLS